MAILAASSGAPESPRRRLLALLGDSDREWDVTELSQAIGLHANTLRGHLQILVDLGQVERRTAPGGVPGRPRVLYRSAPGVVGAESPYRQLAAELAIGMAQANSDEAARAAGRAWGQRVRQQHDMSGRLEPVAAVELAAAGMTELGFVAETEPLGDRIYLTGCPFHELAQTTPSVCDVHAGLLAGLLTELGEVELDRLDPFVRDSLCVAHLRQINGGS
jgi:predicted ArsR family transcriptional regulator